MISDKCEGCFNASGIWFVYNSRCKVYANSNVQHSRIGGCAMRTHNKEVVVESAVKLDPIKASKRQGR